MILFFSVINLDVLSDSESIEIDSIKNTKLFYNSCREQEPLSFLKTSMGLFKYMSLLDYKLVEEELLFINNDNETRILNQTDTSNLLYSNLIQMNRLGFDVLFELRIDINPFNTSKYSIWIERTSSFSTVYDENSMTSILNELFRSSKQNWTNYIDTLTDLANQFTHIEINSPIKETPKHTQLTIQNLILQVPHVIMKR